MRVPPRARRSAAAIGAIRRRAAIAAIQGAAAVSLAGEARAMAADFEVQADTALQGYEVVSPWGEVTLARRRFMQTVGLAVYNLQGKYRPGEADYRVVVKVRLDADFGINARLPAGQAGGETNFAVGSGVRYVPGLQVAPVDVMVGYVEGRNLANGLLGFRLGRQYLTDVLGWWSFDGGLVRLTTPWYVAVEAYGGLEQRGGLPASTSRFEAQGVWRGSHQGFDRGNGSPASTDYPSFLAPSLAPAYGVAVESTGPSWVHGRFSYRHVFNTGTAFTTQFPAPGGAGFHEVTGLRTSQEKLGWAGDLGKPDLGTLKGGLTYDLYNQIFASYFASAEAYLGKRVTVGADADYFVPTFDADSIFNWFTHGPITTLSGRVALRPGKRLDLSASGGARIWWAQGDASPTASGLSGYGLKECNSVAAGTGMPLDCRLGKVVLDPGNNSARSGYALQYALDPANRATSTALDAVVNLSGRYRFGSGDVTFRGMIEAGARGKREGGDLSGEKRWDGGRFTTGAHVSVYGWADPTRPDRDAVSFAYVLAGGFRPASLANMRIEWEHDTNRLVGQRYRVVALVDLKVLK
jgi:hypothetical protein